MKRRNKSNRNNPFKHCTYSMAQSYNSKYSIPKDKGIVYLYRKTPAPEEIAESVVGFTVGERFPYDLSSYPTDFNIMEMISHPFFILSMGNIQAEELAQFEHGEPIEFRVYSGTGSYQNYNLLLCKFKNLIQEYAFNPNLCKNAVLDYMNKSSNVFSVVVLEGITRNIKILRALGFTDETKKELYKIWENMLAKNISQDSFIAWYKGLHSYSTEQLWELSKPIGEWVSRF